MKRAHTLVVLMALTAATALAENAAPAAGERSYGPVRRGDTLTTIAARVHPGKGLSRHQVMIGIYQRNPDAFIGGNLHFLHLGRKLVIPAADELARVPLEAALAEIERHPRKRGAEPMTPAVALAPTAPAVEKLAPAAEKLPPAVEKPAPAVEKPAPAAPAAKAPVAPPPVVSEKPAPAPQPAGEPAARPAEVVALADKPTAPEVAKAAPTEAEKTVEAATPAPVPAGKPADSGTNLVWVAGAALFLAGGAWLLLRRGSGAALATGGTATEPAAARPAQPAPPQRRITDPELENDAEIRLDIAQACMDLERYDAARAELELVSQQGKPEQRDMAQQMLMMMPARAA